MFLPPVFRDDEPATLDRLLEAQPLAQLVTVADGRPFSTPVPVVVERDGATLRVIAHLTKANPQASHDGSAAVMTWLVSSAYITPSWYETKRSGDPKVVPTWNYEAVEAHGTVRMTDDPADVLAAVTALTSRHEQRRADPWAVTDAPADFIEKLTRSLVAVELRTDDVRVKRKLSQNRPEADRLAVTEALATADGAAGVVGSSMRMLID